MKPADADAAVAASGAGASWRSARIDPRVGEADTERLPRGGSTSIRVRLGLALAVALLPVLILSAFQSVLDFQRDLATAQGNELRAIVDYNKSLSNLARNKATTLERYNLQLQ